MVSRRPSALPQPFMRTIEIYDTTLRDGSQGEGVNFSLEDKLAIARRLDQAGVDFIEGGYPLSNPKDAQFFTRARELGLQLIIHPAGCRMYTRASQELEYSFSLSASLVGLAQRIPASLIIGIILKMMYNNVPVKY